MNCFLASIWLTALATGPATDAGPFAEVPLLEVDLAGGRVVAAVDRLPETMGNRLVLMDGARPVGWFRLADRGDGRATFRAVAPLEFTDPQRSRGWLLAPDLEARLMDRWPTYAGLFASIDTVGPGGQSVWVRAGGHQGVRPDDQWLLRVDGQPAARFDVRSVEADHCFCRVAPLAAGLSLRPEQRVELWPGPGLRRRGMARTAAAYVEKRDASYLVWVAALRGVVAPPEPYLDFYRRGRYLGYAAVEDRDELFWYARFVPLGVGPPSSVPPAPPTAPADSAPVSDDAPPPIRVGDTAVIRTTADIELRRFTARVFATGGEGSLINAGEGEGLRPGQAATLVRAGQTLGAVEVVRVQREYSIVRPADRGGVGGTGSAAGGGIALAPGDEIHFGPLPAPPTLAATIELVVQRTLFSARLAGAARPPIGRPLALRSAGRTIGVGVLLMTEGPLACGVALDSSLDASLRPGDTLVLEEEPPPADPPLTTAPAPPP